MNTETNALPPPPHETQPMAPSATRPLYWSVRRELWENRSLYIAPLVVAAIFFFGFVLSPITLPRRMRAAMALDPAQQAPVLAMPFSMAATLIIVTGYIVGIFYCLDALHGERRDRSILFWKSLPVSDLTTVHRVPHGRYVLVADDEVLRCTSDYQRCWFHLFVADMYLARLERLHQAWRLRRSAEQVISLNELSQLREYALRLLDDFSSGSDLEPLKKTTCAMKLRVSLMAQATMARCGIEKIGHPRTLHDFERTRANSVTSGVSRPPTRSSCAALASFPRHHPSRRNPT